MAEQRIPYLQIWLDGKPMADVEGKVRRLEVDERADDASSFHLVLNMAPGEGDWDALADGRFTLLRRVTIGFGLGDTDNQGADVRATVIDGYVTAACAHWAEQRVPDSTLELHGLDASCVMHLDDRTRRWAGSADSDVAKQVFGEYGFQVSADFFDQTTKRDENRSVVMQRGTDADLLRMLARRNGFEVFVEPSGQAIREGADAAAQCTAHFHRVRPDLRPQPALALTPHITPTIIEMTARWESHRPAIVRGEHIDEQTRRIRAIEVDRPRFPRMGKVGRGDILAARRAQILPRRSDARLLGLQHVDVPHEPGEVESLAWSDFVASDWLVEATATVRAVSYPVILRARRPVAIAGAGKLHDGTWYVKTARHRWAWDDEDSIYRVEIDIVRDAMNGVG